MNEDAAANPWAIRAEGANLVVAAAATSEDPPASSGPYREDLLREALDPLMTEVLHRIEEETEAKMEAEYAARHEVLRADLREKYAVLQRKNAALEHEIAALRRRNEVLEKVGEGPAGATFSREYAAAKREVSALEQEYMSLRHRSDDESRRRRREVMQELDGANDAKFRLYRNEVLRNQVAAARDEAAPREEKDDEDFLLRVDGMLQNARARLLQRRQGWRGAADHPSARDLSGGRIVRTGEGEREYEDGDHEENRNVPAQGLRKIIEKLERKKAEFQQLRGQRQVVGPSGQAAIANHRRELSGGQVEPIGEGDKG